MTIFFAFLPFLVALGMIAFLRQPVQRAGIVTLVVTCAMVFLNPMFRLEPGAFFAALGSGSGLALSLFVILFPAFLLYQLLSLAGATDTIAQSIRRYCPQSELQVLLFVLGFAPLMEGVCGFGVSIIVTVPLFLALGLSRKQAALLSILGQPTAMWGALANGLALTAKLSDIEGGLLGANAALLLVPVTLGSAYASLFISGGQDALRKHWVIATLTGGLLVVGEWFFSQRPDIELTGLFASLLPLSFLFVLSRCLTQRQAPLSQDLPDVQPIALRKALTPYLFFTCSLLCVRLIPPLREWGQAIIVLNIPLLRLSIPLLTSPGFWLLMACTLTIILFHMNIRQQIQALRQTCKRFSPSATTMLAFLTTSQLMLAAGMIFTLGTSASTLGDTYNWFAPLPGLLGGWLTGSVTSGNAMFAQLQQTIAEHNHLSIVWIEAAQCAGCALGRGIAPSCLILATRTANVEQGESYLLRRIGPLAGGYLFMITVLFVEVFMTLFQGFPSLFPEVFIGTSVVLCLLIGLLWKGIVPVIKSRMPVRRNADQPVLIPLQLPAPSPATVSQTQ